MFISKLTRAKLINYFFYLIQLFLILMMHISIDIKLASNRHYKRDAHGYSERCTWDSWLLQQRRTVASEIFIIVSEKVERERETKEGRNGSEKTLSNRMFLYAY